MSAASLLALVTALATVSLIANVGCVIMWNSFFGMLGRLIDKHGLGPGIAELLTRVLRNSGVGSNGEIRLLVIGYECKVDLRPVMGGPVATELKRLHLIEGAAVELLSHDLPSLTYEDRRPQRLRLLDLISSGVRPGEEADGN